jgi:hypothetical protein
MSNVPVQRASLVLGILAGALWAGGLATLGAVVAPMVFREVPAPFAADAMTLVFRRFDRVALACAAALFAAEGARAAAGGNRGAPEAVRLACVTAATAAATWQGLVLSPRIEALHRAGAIRGVGAAGETLEATHRLAEAAAKGQLLFVVAALVLYGLALPAAYTDARRDARTR